MKASVLLAAFGLVGSATAAYAEVSSESVVEPRWHVEVRDVRVRRGSIAIDPNAGRLVAGFDLAQNGAAGRSGDDIPYVDPKSVVMHPNPDGTGHGSVTTLTLHTGLSVRIDGTADLPIVHAENVDLLAFDQIMTSGTYLTQPKVATTTVDLPFRPSATPVVAGGYTVGKERAQTMRVFVVRTL